MAVKPKELRKFQQAVNLRKSTLSRKRRRSSHDVGNALQVQHTLFGSVLSTSAKGITMPSETVVKKCDMLSKASYKKR